MSVGYLERKVGYSRSVAAALSRPALAAAGLRIAAESIRSFFFPQFENALLHRRRVVNVDHPLDAAIPFDPTYVTKYLEFVKLWVTTFYRLWRLYGAAAESDVVGFLGAIRRLYAEMGSVYTTVHTTTTRPAKNYDLRFAIIHALDPHLDCVPSLHVILVVANWLLASAIVERHGAGTATGRSRERTELWLQGLRGEALAITESVLFVKQHSVNCIGASLYYLKRRFPAFGDREAELFVRDLFGAGTGPSGSVKGLDRAEELRSVILGACASMDKGFAAEPGRGWRAPILSFIAGFEDT